MRVLGIETKGVRSLRDARFDFGDKQVGGGAASVCIHGPSASGKTSLLDSIIFAKERFAPYSVRLSAAELQRTGEVGGKVSLHVGFSDDERQTYALADPAVALVAGLGAPDGDAPDESVLKFLSRFGLYGKGGKVLLLRDELTAALPSRLPPAAADTEWPRMALSRQRRTWTEVMTYLKQVVEGDTRNRLRAAKETGMLPLEPQDALAEVEGLLGSLCPWLRLEGPTIDDQIVSFQRDHGSVVPLSALSRVERLGLTLSALVVRLALHDSVLLVDDVFDRLSDEDAERWIAIMTGEPYRNQVIFTRTRPLAAAKVNCELRR